MPAIKQHVHTDFNKNQAQNMVLHTLTAHPTSPRHSQTYFNSADNAIYSYLPNHPLAPADGWLELSAIYKHRTDLTGGSHTLSGATVLATFEYNNEGHVTGITTRSMTLADLGFTGDADANKYVHPTHPDTDYAAPNNISIITAIPITNGHISGSITTRALTNADLAALVINDGSTTSTTYTWSAQKLAQKFADLDSTVAGALVYKGGYDASTNTPNLETPSAGAVKKGFTYTITVAGDFLGNPMEVGDMVIAEIDDPSVSGDWTIVNKNIDEILYATESVAGKVEFATQAETNTGAQNASNQDLAVHARALTVFTKAVDNGSKFNAHIGDGTSTSWDLLHGLGTKDVHISVYDDLSTSDTYGDEVLVTRKRLSDSSVRIQVNEAIASNELRICITRNNKVANGTQTDITLGVDL